MRKSDDSRRTGGRAAVLGLGLAAMLTSAPTPGQMPAAGPSPAAQALQKAQPATATPAAPLAPAQPNLPGGASPALQALQKVQPVGAAAPAMLTPAPAAGPPMKLPTPAGVAGSPAARALGLRTKASVQPSDTTPPVLLTGAMAFGDRHACRLNGSQLQCWGDNRYGQLGNGAAEPQVAAPSPVAPVAGGGWSYVAAHGDRTCAIAANGSLWCWGANASGELAQGGAPTVPKAFFAPQPVVIPGQGGAAWSRVAVGKNHACGITSGAGALYCWGANNFGQLGLGTQFASYQPAAVAMVTDVGGRTENYAELAAGDNHTCALSSHGALYCWGENNEGQLGVGDKNFYSRPQAQAMRNWINVAAGAGHTCAVRLNGSQGQLYCWGRNVEGQLGDGTAFGVEKSPQSVAVPMSTPTTTATATGSVLQPDAWQQVYAGGDHTCARTQGGASAGPGLYCWGSNVDGEAGVGQPTLARVPTPVRTGVHSAVNYGSMTALGPQNACTVYTSQVVGSMDCWGAQDTGQLLDGNALQGFHEATFHGRPNAAGGGLTAVPVTLRTQGTQTLASGAHHACAINANGNIQCWGDGRLGALGDGNRGVATSPVQVQFPATVVLPKWDGVVAGDDLACSHQAAVRAQPGTVPLVQAIVPGKLYCWGRNNNRKLDWQGSPTIATTPRAVNPPSNGPLTLFTDWQSVALGRDHACAVVELRDAASGAVHDWLQCGGDNRKGQLGMGMASGPGQPIMPARADPTLLTSLGDTWSQVTVGAEHTCAINKAAQLFCWGANERGQVGVPGASAYSQPQPLAAGGNVSWLQVAAGAYHTCAVGITSASQRFTRCWGANDAGQLGTGNRLDAGDAASAPNVPGGDAFLAVAAAGVHTCASTATAGNTGAATCWGGGRHGDAGSGSYLAATQAPAADLLALGAESTCTALRQSGAITCSGRYYGGEGGNGLGKVVAPQATPQ